ncbi:hypothetical protein [Amycolatopsis dendrobii]|uniref:Uncharacterized protein n=1 Tax=Amycolatopsis dendrobii TaxID=2760662 RepID=A0A7W3VYB6_9PSEU|nr:hypothetical protein [Amycolatopsis dendrobii]MBB1155395.1 hypothetical protein [Amycolatopsis dendrobii]
MLRFTGPDSLSRRAAKPFIAIALTIAALFAGASVATAAPADSTQTGTLSSAAALAAPNTTPPVFNCNYFSRAPFHDVAVSCSVRVGVMRVYLICSNNARINGPVMFAGNTYRFVLSCPGVPLRTINWEALA